MDSIGTLKQEDVAYSKAWIFSWVFHVTTIVFSILQYACFYLYNEKYHPMVMILEEYLEKGWFTSIKIILNSKSMFNDFLHNAIEIANFCIY